MKRCSQCHFTFADDQQFCDFDQNELTDLPEPPPRFHTLPAGRTRRILRSPVSLAILALCGVATSALLVGYLDSVSDPGIATISTSATPAASTPSRQSVPPKPAQPLIRPATKVRSISTQRKLTAIETGSSMPSSILKWDVAPQAMSSTVSRTEVSRTEEPRAARTDRSPQKLQRVQTPAKRSARSNMTATRRSAAKAGQTTQARNHRNIQQRNYSDRRGQDSNDRREQSSAQGKGSRVIAILKKTGSILTKPFRL